MLKEVTVESSHGRQTSVTIQKNNHYTVSYFSTAADDVHPDGDGEHLPN